MDTMMLIYTGAPVENAVMPLSYYIGDTLYVTQNFFEIVERIPLDTTEEILKPLKKTPYSPRPAQTSM